MGESSRFFLRFFSFCVSEEPLLAEDDMELPEPLQPDVDELLVLLSWGRFAATPTPAEAAVLFLVESLLGSLPVIGVIVIVVGVALDEAVTPPPAIAAWAFNGIISIPPVRCTSTPDTPPADPDFPSPGMGVMLTQCFKFGVLSFQIFLYLSAMSWSLVLAEPDELELPLLL